MPMNLFDETLRMLVKEHKFCTSFRPLITKSFFDKSWLLGLCDTTQILHKNPPSKSTTLLVVGG